ncbi:MAG: shikimate kinase [Lachnospiraceae bacterium]|nr:shikimate kinase [Lachnospiraceae bacterium]
MSLILEGFMGSGKSAVGKELAKRLGLSFIDTDALIEAKQDCRIADIFEESGEEAFRQMETAVLQGLLLTDDEAVISLGGGTPVRDANQSIIKALGRVIYLRADASTLIRRLESGTEERPMLKGGDLAHRVKKLLGEREKRYMELADIVIDIQEESIEEICGRIEEAV